MRSDFVLATLWTLNACLGLAILNGTTLLLSALLLAAAAVPAVLGQTALAHLLIAAGVIGLIATPVGFVVTQVGAHLLEPSTRH